MRLLGILAVAVCANSTVSAATIQSFGAGSAVTLADATMNFDVLTSNPSLVSVTEGALVMDYTGSALCLPTGCGGSTGFAGFDYTAFIYNPYSTIPISIGTVDGSDFDALEVRIGTGTAVSVHAYWETYRDSVLVGSGSFSASPQIVGFFNKDGFDNILIGVGRNPLSSFPSRNLIAIDDVSVQYSAIAAVPVPLSIMSTLSALIFLVGFQGWSRGRLRTIRAFGHPDSGDNRLSGRHGGRRIFGDPHFFNFLLAQKPSKGL